MNGGNKFNRLNYTKIYIINTSQENAQNDRKIRHQVDGMFDGSVTEANSILRALKYMETIHINKVVLCTDFLRTLGILENRMRSVTDSCPKIHEIIDLVIKLINRGTEIRFF